MAHRQHPDAPDEVEEGVVQLKDLKNKTQEQVPRADAANRVRALLSD